MKEEIQEHKRQEEITQCKRQEEIAQRKRQEEIAEWKREDEIQIAERRRQEEIQMEECRRREEQEFKERKRKDEMEFELQKIHLGAEGRFSNFVTNQNVNNTQIKPKLGIQHLMQKFNSDENDASLYLIMFERLVKQAEILENTWVTHLLGLLPYDVAQLIAREPDEIANDYNKVKQILLKRYKLIPEKF
ncbi:hypothetical protein AVEN_184066-1 [Araneus ventricosus]|uniref:Uncharacterized protein n=1 Tax=Araneus ventricosus TaxID=182803 RepID=A0A4Y2D1C5_ARAVE|nr:hypothetical protein AVEN_184066-1 [Araneus ventricosus]